MACWCMLSLVTGLVMTSFVLNVATGSATINRRISLKENSPAGTVVAELSDFLDWRIVPGSGKNFKLLSQNLVPASGSQRQWLSLNHSTGSVTLRRKLDREELCTTQKLCVINLQVYVHASSRMVNLDVEIVDVNEHAPIFPVKYILMNVSEGARVGDVINLDQYMAHDSDAGNNSVIVYSLNLNRHFSLSHYTDETGSPHMQVEVRQPLDYERKSLYRLTLTAKDSGSPARSSHVPLQIRVTDENDNQPIFDQQEYTVMLQENTTPGQVIARVQAHDADSGLSGTVRYYITGQNKHIAKSLVEMDRITGELTLIRPLDRESFEKLVIFIEARDLGNTEQRTGRARLVVYIGDVNDNAPIISVSYIYLGRDDTVYLSESTPRNTNFAYVSAKDDDQESNGAVQLSVKTVIPSDITGDETVIDASNVFTLSPNGFLGVNRNLDIETQDRYTILIKACDEGIKQMCSTKEINVVLLDENDHAPKFSHSTYNVTISEKASVGTVVARMNAEDGDALNPTALQENERGEIVASVNGDIVYSISGGSGTFSIEPRTGIITLVRPLDREQLSTWTIAVTAADGGRPLSLKSDCQLVVTVSDTNDNPPVFTNPMRDGSTMYATILRNDVITRIQAADYDEGKNAMIKYKLMSEDGVRQTTQINTSLFIVNANTGDLSLNMSNPTIAQSLGTHVIVVQARDRGSPPMKAERTINVIVTDDMILPTNPPSTEPEFMDSPYTLIIIIAALASAMVLLIVVVFAIVIKCKRENKKVRTYSCNNGLSSRSDIAMCKINEKSSGVKRAVSKESCAMKDSEVWSQASNKRLNSLTYDSTTDVTNLSRNDTLMTHKFLTPPSTLEAPTSNSRVGSFAGKKNGISGLSVPSASATHHDGDSGRGDSDPDVISGDVQFEQGYTRQRITSEISSTEEVSPQNSLGRNCTEQCLRYGHSDTCWMPGEKDSVIIQRNHDDISPRITPENRFRFSSSPFSEIMSQSSRNDHSEQSSNLETIPETRPMHVYWPQNYSASNLSSIYSHLLPPSYVTPTREDYLQANHLDSHELLKNQSRRINSSTDSTTTGYVTEPEII